MKVLIVDDDAISRRVLRTNLEALGHEVTEAEDAESAWEIFRQESFKIVITDWVMPGMDGPDLCRRLRTVQRPEYTYVLVHSSVRGGELSYLEAMDAGADDFVAKPVSPEELAARIRVVRRIDGLRAEVKELRGILPICSYCRKIRTDDDAWASIDSYLASRSDVAFSHGICPTCYETEVEPGLKDLGE